MPPRHTQPLYATPEFDSLWRLADALISGQPGDGTAPARRRKTRRSGCGVAHGRARAPLMR